ncbi:PD-(D/E)XK nuclease family protein [Thiothrix litoralis]|uniref:PD-(D/E)XK nuclease family protein n=1 Tax=Thiothrix litoralis TaxID=2891210 RepID=A0ABX7WVV9_9GAMM|nr:PD-(D/E)XK nuclease family protein [Thiothrix litoralis]QTR47800.1 PD-(D/E)XK nuclease family protein [Thiothrix litoralis]
MLDVIPCKPSQHNKLSNMTDYRELQKILDKTELLRLKYSLFYKKNSFNIFQVLKKGDDEVNVHSNFISELLNPKGSHGKEDIFLRLFIEQTLDITYESLGNCLLVRPEHQNIDIYIEFDKTIIVIENKIHAQDQYRQLERYYEYAKLKNKPIYLMYLTLDGKEPSSDSLGNLSIDVVTLISYKYEVLNWITACIKEAALNPSLREATYQYLDLIKYLTGQSMSAENRKDIISLLKTGDNAKNALQIQKNWIHAKWYAQKYFWEELKQHLTANKGYYELIVPKFTYSSNYIDGYVHRQRSRKIHYGFFAGIKNIDNKYDICLYTEIGHNDDLYYGLGIVEDKTIRVNRKENQFEDIIEKMRKANLYSPNQYWITSTKRIPLRFYSFDDEDTVSMLNQDFRNAFVKSLTDEMSIFIEEAFKEQNN